MWLFARWWVTVKPLLLPLRRGTKREKCWSQGSADAACSKSICVSFLNLRKTTRVTHPGISLAFATWRKWAVWTVPSLRIITPHQSAHLKPPAFHVSRLRPNAQAVLPVGSETGTGQVEYILSPFDQIMQTSPNTKYEVSRRTIKSKSLRLG